MIGKFTIEIASVPDRNHLVAKIWYDQVMVAEIIQEIELVIKFYLTDFVEFDLNEFTETLANAKIRLT